MKTLAMAGLIFSLSACARGHLARPAATAPSSTGQRGGGSALATHLRSGVQCDGDTALAVKPHPQGQIRCCVDDSGRRHGMWIVYSRDGHRLMQRQYHADKKHGPARGWYENGQVHLEGVYEDDKRQGLWRFWNDAGMPSAEIVYRAGEKLEERKPTIR